MKTADIVMVLIVVALSALGGAMAVFSEFDDAPGGVLLGFLLILGATVIGVRAARRRR